MTVRKSIFGLAPAALLTALAFGASAQPTTGLAQYPPQSPGYPQLSPQPPQLPPYPDPPPPGSPFVVYPVRGGLYMITGPGGNTTVQVGYEGALVVDTGTEAAAPGLIAEIRKLAKGPVRYVLNTSADADHTGGNRAVAAAGANVSGGNLRPEVVTGTGGAPIWAHEDTLNRISARGGDPAGWPSDTYFVAEKDLFVNGEPVQLMHAPGHTSGDSLVMFRRSDVISAGDIFTPDRYPVIDLENGGSVQGLLDQLNHLLRLTVPQFNQEGGTLVIPGHGRLSDEADVADYRDMVTFIRDRVRDMIRKRMTLAQVQAARPSLDYDALYGAEAGAVFVEQVYRSLSPSAQANRKSRP
jgi:glyoxylase-like metal-dependent hydrolase (beta-lactamase superfamily II)